LYSPRYVLSRLTCIWEVPSLDLNWRTSCLIMSEGFLSPVKQMLG